MKNLSLSNITAACGGVYIGDDKKAGSIVESITTDSRQAKAGCLFVPICGARADGHDFISQVIEAGALCVLSEQNLKEVNFPYIKVESTLEAVKDIGEYYLQQLSIPVVGITGSVGKTSTKEMIAAVLAQKYDVLKTQGNFNNELGLPLTIFRLRDNHKIAVLEMGISEFGEMHRLAKVARPDTCVLTNIGECHLEFLIDRDGVLRAKTEIFDFLKKDGHIVLNADDDKLAAVGVQKGIKPVSFGLNASRDIYADEIEGRGLKGIVCRIHMGDDSFAVLIPIPGEHMVYNALAAAAVGRIYGLTALEIKKGIESLQSVSGRFHIIEENNCTIIDDCYNANPMSMKASLEVLQDAKGRKIAILGDMGELGENEIRLHQEVGEFAAKLDLDILVCVGKMCEYMADAACSKAAFDKCRQVIYIQNKESLLKRLPLLICEGDTILVKASHFMGFEEVVEALKQ